ARQKSCYKESEYDEMYNAVRRKIHLVVRIEGMEKPGRHPAGELWKPSRHRHDEREREIGASKHEQPPRPDQRHRLECAAQREPSTKDEQQLPAERIEIPIPVRIGVQ